MPYHLETGVAASAAGATVSVLERGPVRAVLSVVHHRIGAASAATQRLIVTADDPLVTVECEVPPPLP